jgi:hypothetical protein
MDRPNTIVLHRAYKHLHMYMYMYTRLLDWLIDYLRFYVSLKNISLIWRHHHCRWRAARFRPMLGAQGLWAGRDLYRATPTVTPVFDFSGLIRRTAPFSRLLRHMRGCGGSILTRILMSTVFLGCLQYTDIVTFLNNIKFFEWLVYHREKIVYTVPTHCTMYIQHVLIQTN